MEGCHKRMGDVWHPDIALTLQQLMAGLALLEEDWRVWKNVPTKRLEVALLGCAMVIGFGGALRGEEIPKADLGELRKHWKEALGHPTTPHVPVGLIGRFKREVGPKSFIMPLALNTASGIPIKLRLGRMLALYESMEIKSGPVFRVASGKGKKVRRAKVRDLDPLFHDLLIRVQLKSRHLIHQNIKVAEDFSMSRSLRRGATTLARIRQIPEEVITANNRWRSEEAARGRTPSWNMMERYSDVASNVELLIRFSKSL